MKFYWTTTEERILRRIAEEQLCTTYMQAQDLLPDRSPGAIGIRLRKLGLKLGVYRQWTEEEDRLLVSMLADGCMADAIADALDRTSGSIRARIIKRKLPKPVRVVEGAWTPEEDAALARCRRLGMPPRLRGRTRNAICGRWWRIKHRMEASP
jgi:hypothetical protein